MTIIVVVKLAPIAICVTGGRSSSIILRFIRLLSVRFRVVRKDHVRIIIRRRKGE